MDTKPSDRLINFIARRATSEFRHTPSSSETERALSDAYRWASDICRIAGMDAEGVEKRLRDEIMKITTPEA